jgi:peptide-methionine (S)-S-oxide reductase
MTETATLAGGCFWGVEELVRKLDGVIDTTVGYAGGTLDNPRYEDVKKGKTGHAESLQIVFDPSKITFGEILDFFFRLHDPTTSNRQGNDVGTQYRSVIFCQTPEQRATAESVVAEVTDTALWDDPIVTEIADAAPFYEAEAYHQEYFARNSGQPYCTVVVAPKVAKFRKKFIERLKQRA